MEETRKETLDLLSAIEATRVMEEKFKVNKPLNLLVSFFLLFWMISKLWILLFKGISRPVNNRNVNSENGKRNVGPAPPLRGPTSGRGTFHGK